ncbi:N-6 DNA methylase [Streptomyces sp. H10-C2]|uniref:N-6 DNA methylase n=1 Tax=unclassified Streptomyces TaxID=2593676 RepID=UPI0024B9A22F|nr:MULTISPECIES: N-6 DNA methylase [unclassified Streptomyces]MDJ0342703.1 N-6 DNA methylase [Streptomyces sp. PH10-H1]MDJ0372588.1 N-6 DNA methylase [Streptomyces sp. H10-C2]
MPQPPKGDDPLLRRSEIATLAGVSRPTVTAWEKQELDFPTPRRSSGLDYFRQSEILAWLDQRPVPRRGLAGGEEHGIVYGARARRNMATDIPSHASPGRGPRPKPAVDSPSPDDQRVVQELMGKVVDRVRGAASDIDYLNLLFSLHHLRGVGGLRWTDLLARARRLEGLPAAAELLLDVGKAVDEDMRRVTVDSTMAEALARLEPRTARDLWKVFDGVARLREEMFGLILDEYERRAALGSGEFFTPRAVVRLMTDLACAGFGPGKPSSVYDPFARGGEFLVEAAAAFAGDQDEEPVVTVRAWGQTRRADTWRLANMNLALHGVQPDVELSRAVPWESDARRSAPVPFDIVLTNPPFNMKDSVAHERERGRWPYGPPPADNDNFAYVQHALSMVGEGGRVGIIMPNKAGNSGHRAEQEIRKKLVEDGVVDCIIALPEKLFTGTSVPVSVWLLRHPGSPCDQVLFLDASKLGTKSGPRRVLGKGEIQSLLGAYAACRAGDRQPAALDMKAGMDSVPSALVSRQELLARNCSLNPIEHIQVGHSQEDSEGALANGWDRLDELKGRLLRAQRATAELPYMGLRESPTHRDDHPGPPVPLVALCEIKAGPSFSRLGAAQRTADGDVPVVFPRHLKDGRISDARNVLVSGETAHRLSAFSLEEGDIVCIRSGAIGAPALVRGKQAGWLMSPNVIRLRVKDQDAVLPEYLLYCLCREEAVSWMRDRAASTAAPSLRTESLGLLQVHLPPLSEQRAIAKTLVGLDELECLHQEFAAVLRQTRTSLTDVLTRPRTEPGPPPRPGTFTAQVMRHQLRFEKDDRL